MNYSKGGVIAKAFMLPNTCPIMYVLKIYIFLVKHSNIYIQSYSSLFLFQPANVLGNNLYDKKNDQMTSSSKFFKYLELPQTHRNKSIVLSLRSLPPEVEYCF